MVISLQTGHPAYASRAQNPKEQKAISIASTYIYGGVRPTAPASEEISQIDHNIMILNNFIAVNSTKNEQTTSQARRFPVSSTSP
jgi:hypothetical protein